MQAVGALDFADVEGALVVDPDAVGGAELAGAGGRLGKSGDAESELPDIR